MKYNYKCIVAKNGKRYYKNVNGKWKRVSNKVGEKAEKGKRKYRAGGEELCSRMTDEEMCKIILTKFFYEKQIIVKNKEIFDYIFVRANRTYYDIYLLVEKIDKLSLEKKRELTIPLIKEIL